MEASPRPSPDMLSTRATPEESPEAPAPATALELAPTSTHTHPRAHSFVHKARFQIGGSYYVLLQMERNATSQPAYSRQQEPSAPPPPPPPHPTPSFLGLPCKTWASLTRAPHHP
jgi:hypothetical protein